MAGGRVQEAAFSPTLPLPGALPESLPPRDFHMQERTAGRPSYYVGVAITATS